MRADRLLSLVLLLRHRGRMTAAQLARELEVSPRTVFRDVEALSTAGIPVYAERGRDGGFALLPGFTTDLTGLTHDEALALLTAQSRATPEALGLGPAFAAAVRKIVAAMPDAARRSATDAADRVLIRQGGWLGDPEPDVHLAAVRRAVFAERLRLRYAARDEPARWRTVDPVGLVEAGGRWYLLATRDGVERTYRLSRVEAVEELDDPVQPRIGSGPGAGLAAPAGGVRGNAADDGGDRPGAGGEPWPISPRPRSGIAEERPDGPDHLRVEVLFGDPRHAERVLWMLGDDVEVLAPAALRDAIAARAAAVAALHTGGPAR